MGRRRMAYHHAVDSGSFGGEGAAVAVYAGVYGAAACWRAAASLFTDIGGAFG
jgi:hypothetical protein